MSRATTVKPLNTASSSYRNVSIEVVVGTNNDAKTYKLPVNGTALVVENRMIGTKNTFEGNVIQCQPVSSNDSFVPGQFPISINDGAASTKWQPEFANNISSITITITMTQSDKGKNVSEFYFDRGQAPPSNVNVVLHDSKIDDDMESMRLRSLQNSSDFTITQINVTISNPWSANSSLSAEISIPQVNTTNFTFAQAVPLRKFATLFVKRNQALDEVDVENKNGTGATVAEWEILSDQ